jgi:hypothetical protein
MRNCPIFLRYKPVVTWVFLAATLVVSSLVVVCGTDTDAADFPPVGFGVNVNPEIQITINGGINVYGKQTIFNGSGVDFGSVNFVHPEFIGNGDAYIQNGRLVLEAVLDVNVAYSGLNSVAVNVTKIGGSPNPFSKCSYSLNLNRSAVPIDFQTEPQYDTITTLTSPGHIVLRTLFEISPKQSGVMTERFRLIVVGT